MVLDCIKIRVIGTSLHRRMKFQLKSHTKKKFMQIHFKKSVIKRFSFDKPGSLIQLVLQWDNEKTID